MKITKEQRHMIMGCLCALLVVMAVAYGTFRTMLNINGTASITSTWDIKILSITPNKTATNTGTEQAPVYASSGDIAHSITNNDLTANFSTVLVSPGDTVTYEVVVKNNGTLNAKLISLTKIDTNNPAISFTVSGIAENDVLEANASKTITVVVTYVNNANGQGQPASTISELGITLNFVQTNDSASSYINGLKIDQTFVPQNYAFHTNYVAYNITPTTTTWTQDPTSLNRNYYLGHDIDGSGNVTANYACIILNNTQYCFKSKDSSGNIYFEQNKALAELLVENEVLTCSTISNTSISCGDSVTSYISANKNGTAFAGYNTNHGQNCGDDGYGNSRCYSEY